MKDLIKFFFNKLDSSEELLKLNFGTRKKIILIFIDLCLSLISCGITYILDSNISEIFDENNKTIIFLIFFSVIFLTSIYVNLYELPIKEQDIEAYIRLFFYSSISFFLGIDYGFYPTVKTTRITFVTPRNIKNK